MTNLSKARERMTQERESFSLEAAELEKSLREAEALLLWMCFKKQIVYINANLVFNVGEME